MNKFKLGDTLICLDPGMNISKIEIKKFITGIHPMYDCLIIFKDGKSGRYNLYQKQVENNFKLIKYKVNYLPDWF